MTETKACPFCQIADGSSGADAGIVYKDDHWLVRTISPTPAVAGWLLMQARRHIGDSAELNAAEAASFGPLLQRTSSAVREVTGALRVYLGSLNEGTPHFHTHVLPRLPEMPNGALGFDAFSLSALARSGKVRAEPEQVTRVLGEIRERLQARAG
jgi:diadenosine tetraphosphate (Ap4A) HIT family hydrolase